MSEAYIISIEQIQDIMDFQQVVARLHLPKGEYIISGKLNAKMYQMNKIPLFYSTGRLLISYLKCNDKSDSAYTILKGTVDKDISPIGFDKFMIEHPWIEFENELTSGTATVLNMMIPVSLENDGTVEMSVFTTDAEAGGIQVSSVVISAIKVDTIHIAEPKVPSKSSNKFRNPFHLEDLKKTSLLESIASRLAEFTLNPQPLPPKDSKK